jgi:hypothetical protein
MDAVRCQCKFNNGGQTPCNRQATQEDFLCDHCRDRRCGILTIPGFADSHAVFLGFEKYDGNDSPRG